MSSRSNGFLVSSPPPLDAVFPRGADLGGAWRVASVEIDPRRVKVCVVEGGTGDTVVFALEGRAETSRPGPFDVGAQRVSYQVTALPFDRFRAAGMALGARLRAASDDPAALVERWISGPTARRLPVVRDGDVPPEVPGDARGPVRSLPATPWAERLRERLVDRPRAVVTLRDVLAPEELPPWPCALPWTRFEVNHRTFGPCCSDYQTRPAPYRAGQGLSELWNASALRAFRRALTGAAPYAPCRASCPTLMGRAEDPGAVRVFGGDEAFVAREVAMLTELFEGREVMQAGPLKVSFTTTTYCNYDCLMCSYGEVGTLADELPAAFYDDLMTLAPGMRLIEALGGEPLASPVFREFLAGFDFERFPSLRVALITNGSYLTPKELLRYRRVPLDNLTISLNAASPETYLSVNRGLPWPRLREHLDALHRLRREGELRCSVTYSLVILRENLHELRAFAELARRDGVRYRFLLPHNDRNGQSIMASRDAMATAREALDALVAEERARGDTQQVALLVGEAGVLADRLAKGIVRLMPDGAVAGRG
jgi:MoaA/NifB/PqqE/SkfB family radical SAM enzyme